MDFADLDLKAASEKGSWVHLSYGGEPIFSDEAKEKPSRVRIKGMGSEGVMSAFRKVDRIETLMRDRLTRSNDRAAEGVIAKSQADLQDAMADLIVAAVSEWENINYGGEPLPFTRENVLKICGPGTLFFRQVNEAIAEEQRLFTGAESS